VSNIFQVISTGQLLGSINTNYVVNLTTDVALTPLPVPNLGAGDTLTINTNGHVFDGATNAAGNSFVFDAGSSGGSVLAANQQPTFAVGSLSDLTAAFQEVSTGGMFTATNTNYVINLTADIPSAASMPRLTLGAGDTLTINTNGHLFDGSSTPELTFSSTGPGGSTVLVGSTTPTTFEISTNSDLAAAIQTISFGSFLTSGVNYVFDLESNLTLTESIPIIALGGGDTLTFEGNGHAISGNGKYGGFYLRSGTASFSDLTMTNLLERGQDGGPQRLQR
jgi:hypothetical protein